MGYLDNRRYSCFSIDRLAIFAHFAQEFRVYAKRIAKLFVVNRG